MFGVSRLGGMTIGALLISALSFSAGMKVDGWWWRSSQQSAIEKQHKAYVAEDKRDNAISASVQQGQEKSDAEYQVIKQRVVKYIDRPVYRNVCLDADGLRDANAALSGAATDPSKSH